MQKKIELLRKTGHIHQVADVTPIEYREGRADKLSAWQVKNGPLSFTVMQGKGMDLSELSYKGVNFSFLSKPGLQGRNQYDTNGQEALRSIMGGMLFTCGWKIYAPYIRMERLSIPCMEGFGRLRQSIPLFGPDGQARDMRWSSMERCGKRNYLEKIWY